MNVGEDIPEMTHEYGKVWDQPEREDIALDKTHALMTESTMKQLSNYAHSRPTAIYPGKMWRASYNEPGENYLFFVGDIEADDMVTIYRKRIILEKDLSWAGPGASLNSSPPLKTPRHSEY